jgi:hypothetical protein
MPAAPTLVVDPSRSVMTDGFQLGIQVKTSRHFRKELDYWPAILGNTIPVSSLY